MTVRPSRANWGLLTRPTPHPPPRMSNDAPLGNRTIDWREALKAKHFVGSNVGVRTMRHFAAIAAMTAAEKFEPA
ncbi:MAG: hypothetical protein ACI875_001674 [Planctomycetota bacterium]|jgi:hypothetical protein